MAQQTFTDQLYRIVSVEFPPTRIISIVPSQTELLFDLGLGAEIIGITKFCNHPKDRVNKIIKVGGTKKLDLDLIRSLKPHLIIGNKEENGQLQIEMLMQEFPVWMSDIYNLHDALQMIKRVGAITGKAAQSEKLAANIFNRFSILPTSPAPLKVAYLIWQKPYMVAAKNTFIDDMLQRCGWQNAFNIERYPQITEDELTHAKPDVIMLSSEPFPFRQKHVQAIQQLCPRSNVILVDGEMFSWYGSRLLKAVPYFKQLILNLNNNLI